MRPPSSSCGTTAVDAALNDRRSDVARKLTVQPGLFLVGEAGGRIVAATMAGYDGHRGWINYFAVALTAVGAAMPRC